MVKATSIALGLAVASMSFGQAINVKSDGGSGVDAWWDGYYSRSHETTISGVITGKIKGDPKNGKAEGMAIIVTTKAGRDYSVQLGPTWYLSQQSTHVQVGDHVRVIGTDLTVGRHHEDVFLPRLLFKGHEILALRTQTGQPYWVAFNQKPKNDNMVDGKIMSEQEADVPEENTREMTYQLQTQNGLVNIAAAPNWYMLQNGLGFKVGDNVTVYTGAGPVQAGPHLILANGIYGTSGTMVLRPNGVPIWAGSANSIFSGN